MAEIETAALLPEHTFQSHFPFTLWAALPNGRGACLGRSGNSAPVRIPACRTWRAEAHVGSDADFGCFAAELEKLAIPEVLLTAHPERFQSMLGARRIMRDRLAELQKQGTSCLRLGVAPSSGTRLFVLGCDRLSDYGALRLAGVQCLTSVCFGDCAWLQRSVLIGLTNLAELMFVDCTRLAQVELQNVPLLVPRMAGEIKARFPRSIVLEDSAVIVLARKL